MTEPTLCQHCDNLHPHSKGQPEWRWLCAAHPCLPTPNYLTDDKRLLDPPFLRAKAVNGGKCPLFEPRREPEGEK